MPYDLTQITWLVFAPLAGMLIGSFLNVCIYRLPKKETIVRGHSYCPACRHTLAAADLIPVFSYLFLGRRCRYCRSSISARYAIVETIVGLYFFLTVFSLLPHRLNQDAFSQIPAFLPGISLSSYATLLILSNLTSFCGLLVWALIIWDKNNPPAGLFIFIVIPIVAGLLLQPKPIIWHLFYMLFCFVGVLIFYLIIPIMNLLKCRISENHIQIKSKIPLIALIIIALTDIMVRLF